ncbi:type IIB restriction/modification system, specificity subunit [Campylobacter lari]|uniref:restriction endonuclease subunit S n=1 Tax=Campylobacter TaxID=194 RepID=UPI002153732D|nr:MULTISPECIES: restriction endonuclease subunit S [Campylobacter]MCR6516509.1 restriction endonuclease subunit S [Campylobacter lari]MCV3456387.1 restriction endonuclease subunit S [Campylobacter sp. CNRCH_2016_0050h]
MELNIKEWKKFKVADIFQKASIKKHSSIPKKKGNIAFISSSSDENGCSTFCDVEPFTQKCITVSTNGKCFDCFYHDEPIAVSTDVEVLVAKWLNKEIAIFICSILQKEQIRYTYGSKPKNNKVWNTIIPLPVKTKDSIEPDFDFMEKYIKTLKSGNITTHIKENLLIDLQIYEWQKFYIKDLFYCYMGNGIDYSSTTKFKPTVNFVSRDSKNNGVVDVVDVAYDKNGKVIQPLKPGLITLSLGGSFLGSCYIQKEPFYTAQNVAILQEKELMSIYVKLFISTLIRYECKTKYVAFGRELNTHYNKDFYIKLPIKKIDNSRPFIDNEHKFSKNGFVPDFDFIEKFIKSLPYSDRLI